MNEEPLKSDQATASAEPVGAGPQRRRLLVVDDRELTCKQLQQILQSDTLDVAFCTGGAQALRALQEADYSILLTDLQMPEMSGMELIREVQQLRIPVTMIVIAGHGSIGEAVQAIRLGAYDFLAKPIDPQHLRLVVERRPA